MAKFTIEKASIGNTHVVGAANVCSLLAQFFEYATPNQVLSCGNGVSFSIKKDGVVVIEVPDPHPTRMGHTRLKDMGLLVPDRP